MRIETNGTRLIGLCVRLERALSPMPRLMMKMMMMINILFNKFIKNDINR